MVVRFCLKVINDPTRDVKLNVTPLIKRASYYFFFAALYCSRLGLNGLFALLTWNYCLLALPRYEGGNKGSYHRHG